MPTSAIGSDRRAKLSRTLTKEAAGDACIRIRPEGRQLCIDRGMKPTPDHCPNADGTDDAEAVDHTGVSPTKRSRITGFSDASRRRLRQTIHRLRRDAESVFLTLTWHECTPTPGEAKRALDRFLKRIRRRFPDVSAVWKLEPQQRGVPHYHLLVFGLPFVPWQHLSRLWHECTAETSTEHRRSGLDVQNGARDVHSNDGKLQAYLSKYLDKCVTGWPTDQMSESDAQAWEHPGRFWGVLNRKALPVAAWGDWAVHVDHHEAAELISDLLDQWGIDLGGIVPPSLTINTRGDPEEALTDLLSRL